MIKRNQIFYHFILKIIKTQKLINELYSLYNDINFTNINKDYIEVNEGEIDAAHYIDDEYNV